jgi:arabinan endo-1,5-alpha-L-arabinosidase
MATGIASAQEPVLGDYFAHDPSTMIKEGNRYYIFYTGFAIPYKYSTDLRNWTWTSSQRIFPAGPPAWVTNAVPGFDQNYWAPDVAYFNGKYHVYYSVSRWGTIDSAIGLVTSPSLITPVWIDQGKVVQSDAVWEAGPDTDTTSFNCIDPSILLDTNGTIWMVYGSYSDGILVTQIDPATGKRLNPASIGTKIASSSTSFFNNTTEGAHIHQRGGYYWLFLNYGGCCSGIDSTYNIRVGRSTSVTGPYLDKNGVNMLSGGGTMLLESTGRFVGPGHAGIFIENGTNWFTYHYYDANNNAEVGRATLGLTQIQWAEDGWPALTNHWSAFYPFEADAREHRRQFDGAFCNWTARRNTLTCAPVWQTPARSPHG